MKDSFDISMIEEDIETTIENKTEMKNDIEKNEVKIETPQENNNIKIKKNINDKIKKKISNTVLKNKISEDKEKNKLFKNLNKEETRGRKKIKNKKNKSFTSKLYENQKEIIEELKNELGIETDYELILFLLKRSTLRNNIDIDLHLIK